MQKEILNTDLAPKPIGPYSQSVRAGSYLFCSGQLALDPNSGEFLHPENVSLQTERVMKNIEAVLKNADLNFEHVVKTTIFLKSMDDFPKVNEVYGKYFKVEPPARSTVEVARLPKNALVEIEVIAYCE